MGDWLLPPAGLTLSSHQVHLWQAVLEATPERLVDYWGMLAPDERERAERFRFPEHRDRFVIGRGILRVLLGNYLALPPARVRFDYGARGKPFLAAGLPLGFNVSHSRDRALFAFAWHLRVGVDLEYARPLPEAVQLAARFFCPAEVETIAAVARSDRQQAFFRAWTRKEAYLKATGEGILGLADVEVTVGVPPQILAIRGDRALARRWSLHHLEPAANFVCALAVEEARALACWQFVAARSEP